MCGQLHFEYIPLQSDRFVLYVCVRVFVRPASEVFRCVVYIVHRCSFSHSFSKSGGKQQRDSNKIFQRKHRLFDVFLLFRSFASCWCRCRCRCRHSYSCHHYYNRCHHHHHRRHRHCHYLYPETFHRIPTIYWYCSIAFVCGDGFLV